MITANDLRKYPNGEELVAKVNNGDLTLGQAAVLAVKASNDERDPLNLLIKEINKSRGTSVVAKTELSAPAKALVEALNKNRG